MRKHKKIKLSTRERVIVSITLVASLIGHYKWWVQKKQFELFGLETKRQSLAASNQDTEKLIHALKEKRQLASMEVQMTDRTRLSQYLVNSTKLTNLINTLSKESKDHFYNVIKIESLPVPNKETAKEPYETLYYSISLDTSFLSVGKFVEELETASLMLDVSSVTIKRVDSDLKRCLAEIKLYSYVPHIGGQT